ncbi:hypothetical protein [Nitrospira sp. Kam-Ns4a]
MTDVRGSRTPHPRGLAGGDGISRVAAAALAVAILTGFAGGAGAAAPESPYTKQYEITVDATALEPPTWWHVPGITPLIWSLDPASTEAYRTTQVVAVKLKPGTYRFGTFTFDFPFTVTLDGVLDFAPSLDQCVEGRGTRTLKVRCSRTQPYSGEREYWRENLAPPSNGGQPQR